MDLPGKKPDFSYYYHPNENQKNGELMYMAAGGLAIGALASYLI